MNDSSSKITTSGDFICPDHKEVVFNSPGKCPDCGKQLIEGEKPVQVFRCSMELEEVLKKAEEAQNALKVTGKYHCPNHREITGMDEAYCPKCGTKLVSKNPG